MDSLVDTIIDFVRVRQLNIAVAVLLTVGYLVYQYWGMLFKGQDELLEGHRSNRMSRSRSRSCSRSRTRGGNYHDYKLIDTKHSRRGRKTHRRCPDCSLCNYEE